MVTLKKARPGKTITVCASVGALVGSGIIGCGGKASEQQDFIETDNVSSQRSTYQQKQMSRIEASRSSKESGASYGNIRAGS